MPFWPCALNNDMASNRDTQHTRDTSSSSDSSSSSTSADSRKAGRASYTSATRASSNVIDLQDPTRVLECSQVERQQRFQHLVRHYLSQILHGCKSAHCDTPTCLSSAKRNASRPHRPPTQLTATALAHYLASQHNPRRGLCPNELKLSPDTLEIEGGPIHKGQDAHGEHVGNPFIQKLAQQYGHSRRESSAGDTEQQDNQRILGAVKQRQQARKDPKSLGQNLYDSFTIIYSYSKHIPSPASVLASLHQTETTNHILSTNGHTVTPHANAISRQHSQSKLETHDRLHANNNAAKVSSIDQQIHKIPYHPPSNLAQRRPSTSADPASLAGASNSPPMSIAKTGKKNFTIGASSLPDMGRTQACSAAPGHDKKRTSTMDRTVPSLPIIPSLNCDILDRLKEDVYGHSKDRSRNPNYVVDYDGHLRSKRTNPTVNRSLFYTLSNPDALLSSFHDTNQVFKDSPLPHLDSTHLVNSFRHWNRRNGALIFDSLWLAVEALFTPPPELDVQKSPRLRPSRKGASTDSLPEQSTGTQKATTTASPYLSTQEAAHIVMICIHALTSSVPMAWPHTWAQIRKLRSWGIIVPNAAPNTNSFKHPYIDIIDELEYEPALRLADRLLRAIGTRTCYEHILASLKKSDDPQGKEEFEAANKTLVDVIVRHLEVVERVTLASKRRMNSNQDISQDPGWTVTATFMEWLRTIIIKKWDSKAVINKWSSVGTAIMIFDKFHAKYESLNLRSNMFEIPLINERLDTVEEPVKFLHWEETPNTLHVFQYSSLFSARHLVAYFRTINFTEMMKQYDSTMRTTQMQRSLDMFLREPYEFLIKSKMKVTLSEYLVLNVSRENPLKDTLDQLWGIDERMLLKPLKVKMGHEEGEVGLDHGGVTYEFFRVILSEAFKPDNGMFTIDPQTWMTWFQPGSLESTWKFEMLGIIFSLAMYNGITLPVTFPLAFYTYLQTQGNPSSINGASNDPTEYIRDGWPDLASSFSTLLSWSDGDVEDVFTREYVFSYTAFGQRIDHNLAHPFTHANPSSTPNQEDPAMVTNANRHQYVADYIRALTHTSVLPQLSAFLSGFNTCISPLSLRLFTPLSLRSLIEGTQHISIPALRHNATYADGYDPTHPTILTFWSIVETYTQLDRRRLLEFVTASERVPVTGFEGVTFCIVRVGGAEEGLLPSSSTCFGKLYLPEYGEREVMEGKLGLAVGNSRGFGVV